MAAAERIIWAVETLAVKDGDSLLEIGCGQGAAVGLIAPRLKSGHMLAIDRSATAIAAAKRNNATWERQGKASFRQTALAELAEPGPFDKIFSINVNVFWVDPRAELPLLSRHLKKCGLLYLFYEPPAATQRDKNGAAALLCVIVMRTGVQ